MSDTTVEPITLEAFDPAELLMDANARSDAEATVDKAFVASLKAHAATSPKFPVYGDPTRLAGCGNYVPITIVRRPDGQLRVRAGHRRNIGCIRAGAPRPRLHGRRRRRRAGRPSRPADRAVEREPPPGADDSPRRHRPLMDANARTNAQATVTKADVALCKTIAASRPDGCGNHVPITIVAPPRRPAAGPGRAPPRHRLPARRRPASSASSPAPRATRPADRRARLIEQWNENHHRVPMTVRDDGAVLLALFDEEEMTEAAIAKATGLARPQVAASLTVARSETAAKAAERWDFLTLDQAAALAEFEGDPEALTALVQAAKGQPRPVRPRRRPAPHHPRRAGSQGRVHRRARGAGHRDLRRPALRAVDPGPGEPARRRRERDQPRGARHLPRPGRDHHLRVGLGSRRRGRIPGRARPGRRRRPVRHRVRQRRGSTRGRVRARLAGRPPPVHRPGAVRPRQRARPAQRARRPRTQQTAEDEAAEAARKTEERRRVRQRNTEWRAATETRTSHLKALLGRKAPPAGALKLIVEAMARGETQPLMSSFGHETACELLGLHGNGAATGHRDLLLAELARASEKRTQVIALAMVLGAAEHGVRDVHIWQSAEGSYWSAYGIPAAARYLAWLAEHTGYGLSDIEAEVAAHAAGTGEQAGETGPDPDDEAAGQRSTPPPTRTRPTRSQRGTPRQALTLTSHAAARHTRLR